jgi:hypothetical protein
MTTNEPSAAAAAAEAEEQVLFEGDGALLPSVGSWLARASID